MFRPCIFTWNASDRTMRLAPYYAKIAAAQFRDGEDYPLEVREQRSSKEHNHYMAAVGNAHANIRDDETLALLSTPNKLRGWALIQTGWCDVTAFGPMPFRSAVNAAKKAAFNFRLGTEYVEVTLVRNRRDDGSLDGTANVVIKTPKSQSRAAMEKEDFRASKRDVLDLLSGQIEVKRSDLERISKEVGP